MVAETFAGIYEPEDQIGLDPASTEYLRRIACPVLLISSKTPNRVNVSKHPASAVVVWDDAGHWSHQERPEVFNRLVLDWIDGLTPASRRGPHDPSGHE